MITLGIVLAARAKRTALCRVDWSGSRPRVDRVELEGTDERIVQAMSEPDLARVGVDVPFGWPEAFVQLLRGELASDWATASEELRLRATDRYVRQQLGMIPLSVSASMLAAPAMRFRLLKPRVPSSVRVHEVYPAAALTRWGIIHRGYKAKQTNELEPRIALAVFGELRAGLDLDVSEEHLAVFERGTDAIDALVAALVARAVALSQTDPVPDGLREAARREGWIELPREPLRGLR